MTTIGSSLSSYFQLSSQLSGQSGASSGSSASGSSSLSLTEELAQALDSASSASGSSDAFLLDLSPAAQSLLGGTGASSASGASSTKFTLTSAQETEIKNILEKYKNAPFTQATYDDIQNDLAAAGLGPEQLSAEDQVTSFNSTAIFLDALNGNYSSIPTPSSSSANEQTKANNYMQSIVSAWQSISTTASASGSGSASSGSGAAAATAGA